jgi:hypothetical protein
MATPNLPNSVQLHAAGTSDGAGALQAGSANVQSVVRNGVGDYTVTLGTPIDPTTRSLYVQPTGAAMATATINTETSTSFQVLMFTAAGAAFDAGFHFEVSRRSIEG